MVSVISVIPARAGSVGVPGKNLEKIQGLSLVARSYHHSRVLNPTGPLLLTTDSQEVLNEVASAAGISPPRIDEIKPGSIRQNSEFLFHRRPTEQASSTARVTSVLKSIRDELSDIGHRFNAWTLLQPTSPFRSRHELTEFCQLLLESDEVTSIVSVQDVDDFHPARMYSMSLDQKLTTLGLGIELQMANRQELPKVYIRDGGFYIIGDSLVREKKQFSDHPTGVSREFPWTLNVDKPQDLLLARAIGRVEGEGIDFGG